MKSDQTKSNQTKPINHIMWVFVIFHELRQERKLYRSDEPDTPDTAGEAKTSSLVTYYYGPPHMAKQKQDDQPELTYSSYVRTQDVTQKTCRR